jgi:hypothetical protein
MTERFRKMVIWLGCRRRRVGAVVASDDLWEPVRLIEAFGEGVCCFDGM